MISLWTDPVIGVPSKPESKTCLARGRRHYAPRASGSWRTCKEGHNALAQAFEDPVLLARRFRGFVHFVQPLRSTLGPRSLQPLSIPGKLGPTEPPRNIGRRSRRLPSTLTH